MTDEFDGQVDLLGDPWREPKDRRGRKSHRWLPQIAEKVAVLRASNRTIEEIALRLNLDPKTLTKYYSRELDEGPALAKSLLNEAMWEKAKAGNVGAARYLREEFAKGQAERIARPDRPVAVAPKEEKLGKKEQRRLDAEQVGGRFATPAPPLKLAVNNN